MPAPATTNITISSILDLIGGAAPTPPVDKNQLAFDTLLQPLLPTSQPAAEERRETSVPRGRDDRPVAPRSSISPPDSPPPANHSTGTEPTIPQDLHSSEDPGSKFVEATADETATSEDHSYASEQVVAESLAGLPVVNATTVARDPAADMASTGETNASESAEPGLPLGKRKAAIRQPAEPALAAAKSDERVASGEPSQSTSSPDRTSNESTAAREPATEKMDFAAAEPAQDQRAAAATEATIALDDSQLEAHASQAAESPHDNQHDDSPGRDADTITLETTTQLSPPSGNSVASKVPPLAPVTAPQSPIVDPAQSTSTSPTDARAIAAPPRSRLPAEVLAPAASTNGRHAPVEIDSARLLTRVARAFAAAQEQDGEVHLRLSPPELGSLRLDVRIQDGALIAHLQTETDAARAAILDNLPALRERLADQGIRIERFDVDLMQRQPGGMPDQPGGRQQDLPAAPRAIPILRERPQPAVSPNQPTISAAGAADGLNVIV